MLILHEIKFQYFFLFNFLRNQYIRDDNPCSKGCKNMVAGEKILFGPGINDVCRKYSMFIHC